MALGMPRCCSTALKMLDTHVVQQPCVPSTMLGRANRAATHVSVYAPSALDSLVDCVMLSRLIMIHRAAQQQQLEHR